MELLLAHGSPVDNDEDMFGNRTSLLIAVFFIRSSCVRILLTHGASLEKTYTSASGRTAAKLVRRLHLDHLIQLSGEEEKRRGEFLRVHEA